MKRLLMIGALLAGAVISSSPVRAASADSAPRGASAQLGSTKLDLGRSWGDAKACVVEVAGVTCFASEDALDDYLADSPPPKGGLVNGLLDVVGNLVASVSSTCSSTVRLYSATSYTGMLLAFNLEYTFINLAPYGFDNMTSSYKIGPCAAYFYDGASGSGSVYPGYTGPGAQYPSLVAGWDNRISSLYIT